MFLKREVRGKDGKEHVFYYLAESTRAVRDRVVQRRWLNLGELNTTQIDRWQRSIEVALREGTLGNGDSLPTVRALAEQHQVVRVHVQ
jgi:hypothetical protein